MDRVRARGTMPGFPFMSMLPSYSQFRLLQFGAALGLVVPVVAAGFVIRSFYYVGDYVTAVRNATRLEREGTLATVPLTAPPHYNDYREKWVCRLRLADGSEVDYLRGEEPAGLKELRFYEHPEITGTLIQPRYEYEAGHPHPVVVEISKEPDWDELFKGLTGSTFMVKTAWLSTLIAVTLGLVWMAWRSYWWMKGGKRRKRRRHRAGPETQPDGS